MSYQARLLSVTPEFSARVAELDELPEGDVTLRVEPARRQPRQHPAGRHRSRDFPGGHPIRRCGQARGAGGWALSGRCESVGWVGTANRIANSHEE